MITQSEMINQLKKLKTLLLNEKEALVNNKPDKVNAIVEEKNKWMAEMKDQEQNFKDNNKIIDLIEDIQKLQDINMLLTRQALSFQNALLETLAKNINNLSNTYSEKGNMYNTENHSKLVDQSV